MKQDSTICQPTSLQTYDPGGEKLTIGKQWPCICIGPVVYQSCRKDSVSAKILRAGEVCCSNKRKRNTVNKKQTDKTTAAIVLNAVDVDSLGDR